MVYAIFMLLVLLTLAAGWRGHILELPLFLVTVALGAGASRARHDGPADLELLTIVHSGSAQ